MFAFEFSAASVRCSRSEIIKQKSSYLCFSNSQEMRQHLQSKMKNRTVKRRIWLQCLTKLIICNSRKQGPGTEIWGRRSAARMRRWCGRRIDCKQGTVKLRGGLVHLALGPCRSRPCGQGRGNHAAHLTPGGPGKVRVSRGRHTIGCVDGEEVCWVCGLDWFQSPARCTFGIHNWMSEWWANAFAWPGWFTRLEILNLEVSFGLIDCWFHETSTRVEFIHTQVCLMQYQNGIKLSLVSTLPFQINLFLSWLSHRWTSG